MILVVTEQRDGSLNPVSWETIAAAQQMGDVVKGGVAGSGVGEVAREVAQQLICHHEDFVEHHPAQMLIASA